MQPLKNSINQALLNRRAFILVYMKKLYYHILEYGSYGEIGYQGYYLTLDEAQNEALRLQGYFPDSAFVVEVSDSKYEPTNVTI